MDRKEKFSVTLTYENGHPVLNQVAIILCINKLSNTSINNKPFFFS